MTWHMRYIHNISDCYQPLIWYYLGFFLWMTQKNHKFDRLQNLHFNQIANNLHYMITNLLAKLKSPLSNKIPIFFMTLPFLVDIKQMDLLPFRDEFCYGYEIIILVKAFTCSGIKITSNYISTEKVPPHPECLKFK